MLASHNSYTYQKSTNFIFNLLKSFWKCQQLNIDEQYNKGVRVFDIRISSCKDSYGNSCWHTSHGLAKFKECFYSIYDICELFINTYKESKFRIILEDKNIKEETLDLFLKESYIEYLKHKDIIWEIGTHHPWKIYYVGNFKPTIKEYYCHLFNWNTDKSIMYNIKHFDFSSLSIKKYAKKHNPKITKEMIEEKDTMYIMDYIN